MKRSVVRRVQACMCSCVSTRVFHNHIIARPNTDFVPRTPPLTEEVLAELASSGGLGSRSNSEGFELDTTTAANGQSVFPSATTDEDDYGNAGGGDGGGSACHALPNVRPRLLYRSRANSPSVSPRQSIALPGAGAVLPTFGSAATAGATTINTPVHLRASPFAPSDLALAVAATAQQIDEMLAKVRSRVPASLRSMNRLSLAVWLFVVFCGAFAGLQCARTHVLCCRSHSCRVACRRQSNRCVPCIALHCLFLFCASRRTD